MKYTIENSALVVYREHDARKLAVHVSFGGNDHDLQTMIHRANTQPALLEALIWAEAAIAPFSKEPAEKSGINMVRAAIKAAKP